jgi:hypothetical protein
LQSDQTIARNRAGLLGTEVAYKPDPEHGPLAGMDIQPVDYLLPNFTIWRLTHIVALRKPPKSRIAKPGGSSTGKLWNTRIGLTGQTSGEP